MSCVQQQVDVAQTDPMRTDPDSAASVKMEQPDVTTMGTRTDEDYLDLIFLREGEEETTDEGGCRGGGGSQRPQWK